MVIGINTLLTTQITPAERDANPVTETALRLFSPFDVATMSGKPTALLHVDAVQQSTQVTGQFVDLHSYTLPAGALASDGDSIEIQLHGALHASSPSELPQCELMFGSSVIGGVLNNTVAIPSFSIHVILSRRGPTSQYSTGIEAVGGNVSAPNPAIVFAVCQSNPALTETLANPIVIKARAAINAGTLATVFTERLIVRKLPV